jgi:hypothetical protein
MESIIIPNTVRKIGSDAFGFNSYLKSVSIPDSVEYIGHWAFAGCKNLTSIILSDNNPYFTVQSGVLFDKSMTTLKATCPQKMVGDYMIPLTVKVIEAAAFSDCELLYSVVIHSDVIRIEECTFYNCNNLKYLKMPEQLKYVGKYAFKKCLSLEIVKIPNNVETIDECAFSDCTNMRSIEIPASIKTIGNKVFRRCFSLKEVIINQLEPPIIEKLTFNNVNKRKATLIVPAGCKNAYQKATVWKTFGKIIENQQLTDK